MIRTTRTRRGVTLVEMMVAAAMSILGMWLLTWLYQQGLDNFRGARARADLAAQERMVVTLLTRDLKADHFSDDSSKPNSGRRLSDQRMDQIVLGGVSPNQFVTGGYTPPRGGYFRAGTNTAVGEGSDTDGFSSSHSTGHFLQFTMILPGGPNHQQFSAEIAAGSGSQWFSTAAEVTYYLAPNGSTPGGLQLYDLYRAQRLAGPTNDYVQAYNPPAQDPNAFEVMALAPGPKIATLSDLTIPFGKPGSVRLAGPTFTSLAPTSLRYGEDKLMSNVLSFEVKFTGTPGAAGGLTAPWPALFPGNSDYPYDFLPFDGLIDTHSPRVTTTTGPNFNNDWRFDVATNAQPTRTLKPLRITGAQIRLRAFDPATRTTRQTTFTVDL